MSARFPNIGPEASLSSGEESVDLSDLIKGIDSFVPDSKKGLPQEVFFLVSRMTPMVSVDLLIRNEKKQTLLTWRKDEFYHGWHVAGGIIRFKERIADRIAAVAKSELGATVDFEASPIAMNEKINPARDVRGHFICFLYRCQLTSSLSDEMKCQDPAHPVHGQWMWHDRCPKNMIPQHDIYRKFIDT
jgi:ADP-ribose pyrophosphatase YjhB (NUDIX family)